MKNQSPAVPDLSPVLTIVNNHATTTSLEVARVFKKRHDHVIRGIRALEVPDDLRLPNFGETTYIDNDGREQPMFTMTKDGFVFLAMGFTGKHAAQFKWAYIEAFNKMEAALIEKRQALIRNPPHPELLPILDIQDIVERMVAEEIKKRRRPARKVDLPTWQQQWEKLCASYDRIYGAVDQLYCTVDDMTKGHKYPPVMENDPLAHIKKYYSELESAAKQLHILIGMLSWMSPRVTYFNQSLGKIPK